jgi:FkbM family methyltransferase
MHSAITYLIKKIGGKIKLQKYFEYLHSLSLIGMNYGNGGDFRTSGENFAIKYIKSKLISQNKEVVVFDVGANIGDYSINLLEAFKNETFKIYSFEPSKHTYNELLKKVHNYKNIISFNFGFGETNETLKLFSNASLSHLASVYKRNLDHIGINMLALEEIKIKKIDDFCEENNIQKINFLKLDVEGHEYKCLLGAKKMIGNKKIDFIQFEFGGTNIDSGTYFRDFWHLLKDNYNFYRIVKNGLHPIKNYRETLEIFTTINYLLEIKK